MEERELGGRGAGLGACWGWREWGVWLLRHVVIDLVASNHTDSSFYSSGWSSEMGLSGIKSGG